MADLQMQKMIELQRECRSEIGIEKGAPLVPTRFILWLIDRVQKLEQCNVLSCKELLLQLKNKEMSLVEDKSLEMPERKEHAKNKFALDYVMKLIEELPAL